MLQPLTVLIQAFKLKIVEIVALTVLSNSQPKLAKNGNNTIKNTLCPS